jgi:hypothetical protein
VAGFQAFGRGRISERETAGDLEERREREQREG